MSFTLASEATAAAISPSSALLVEFGIIENMNGGVVFGEGGVSNLPSICISRGSC